MTSASPMPVLSFTEFPMIFTAVQLTVSALRKENTVFGGYPMKYLFEWLLNQWPEHFSADFGKFQSVYQFAVYATVAIYKKTVHFQFGFLICLFLICP